MAHDVHLPRHAGRKRRPVSVTLPIFDGGTPERLAHAIAAGHLDAVETFESDPNAGGRRELRRRRFISPLEALRKSGALNGEQFAAAMQYQRHANLAEIVGPVGCVRYEPRGVDGGAGAFLLPIEAAADHLIQLARAQASCGPRALRMLRWIEAEAMGWRCAARLWFKGYSESVRERRFITSLRAVCDKLEAHYGKAADHST